MGVVSIGFMKFRLPWLVDDEEGEEVRGEHPPLWNSKMNASRCRVDAVVGNDGCPTAEKSCEPAQDVRMKWGGDEALEEERVVDSVEGFGEV